jgi:phage tail sheath protein FI
MSLADSIKTNANWLAIAGVTRGGVMNLSSGGMDTTISNGAADKMQPRDNISINAITNIKPYGYTIWGNRTLKKNAKNLVATSFLNIRNLVSDVKKTCYDTARSMTFEQDTDILWINFKAEISKLLNRMVTGYGISGYKILRDTSHKKAVEKGTICAKVILFPTYAVEDFYITIVLKDDEVTVE